MHFFQLHGWLWQVNLRYSQDLKYPIRSSNLLGPRKEIYWNHHHLSSEDYTGCFDIWIIWDYCKPTCFVGMIEKKRSLYIILLHEMGMPSDGEGCFKQFLNFQPLRIGFFTCSWATSEWIAEEYMVLLWYLKLKNMSTTYLTYNATYKYIIYIYNILIVRKQKQKHFMMKTHPWHPTFMAFSQRKPLEVDW